MMIACCKRFGYYLRKVLADKIYCNRVKRAELKARLQATSESWITTFILVLNLVKLPGVALLSHYLNMVERFSADLLSNKVENYEYFFLFL